jgi:hypothetical protein
MTEENKPKKKRSFLVRAFRKAVFTTLAICGLYAGWYAALYAGRGEKLTRGEAAMVKGIFGNEINTSKIRKHFRSESSIAHVLPDKIGMVPPPFSHIDFYGPDTHSKDYTKDTKKKFSLFMHEVTHTWQGQTLNFPLRSFGKYEYTLTPKSRFNDFGIEQQAEIIEDYSEAWLYKDPKATNTTHTAQDSLIMKVVEKRFPRAQKTRMQFQRTGTIRI